MKIVVLNGSPRVKGNTAAMVTAFSETAQAAGHEVKVFALGRTKVNGCLACEYCHTKGNGTCIQKDDMPPILQAINEADALIVASPIYYFTLSAQTQSVIQRTYAIGRPANLKKAGLLLSSESPNVYAPSIAQFQSILSYWGVNYVGDVTAHGQENKSEATLAACRELVAKLG